MSDVKKILLVGDYGQDDLAFKEVTQRLYEIAEEKGILIQVDIVTVNAFNFAQTAAVVAKAVHDGQYDLIYHNTAPRKDTAKERIKNAGEGLAYSKALSKDGKPVQVVGVYGGDEHTVNTFALLPKDTDVRFVDCPDDGTQFRSRGVFPPSVIDALTKSGIKLRGDLVSVPKPVNRKIVTNAEAYAATQLEEAYKNQLSIHGDAAKEYITIVGSREKAQELLHQVQNGGERDFIPIKTTKDRAIEAGFIAAQLALNSKQPQKRKLFVLPKEGETLLSVGQLYDAELDNGAHIVTSDLRALAFAKTHIKNIEFRSSLGAPTPDGKPRFRFVGLTDVKVDPSLFDLPNYITPAYVDGYGNVKLAITHKALLQKLGIELKVGDEARASIQVNDRQVEAKVREGLFSVKDGEWSLSRGSSGWGSKNDEYNFAEISHRGNDAAVSLGNPQPGNHIVIQRLPPHTDISAATSVDMARGRVEEHGQPQRREAGL